MFQRKESDGIVIGFILLFVGHFVAFYLLFGLVYLISAISTFIPKPILNYLINNAERYQFFNLLISIGLTQLIYVIPVCYCLKRKQRIGLMKGVIIGAVVTALLNGGCWLLILGNVG